MSDLDLTTSQKFAVRAGVAFLRATLKVSPKPTVSVIRKLFAEGGEEARVKLERHAPDDVASVLDERYGENADDLLDVYAPRSSAALAGPRPTVVWIHGGGWIGGSKEDVRGYLKLLTEQGFIGVGIRYTLAPEGQYPTPLRQTMAALRHLCDNAERLGIDPNRLFIAGDSAGAQITSQVATLVTSPSYAELVGVKPTIEPGQLAGVGLCCGSYDPFGFAEWGGMGALAKAMCWSYAGTRHFASDPYFATTAVLGHLTADFPPTFLTVGNGDPLARHSRRLADTLSGLGVEVETLFFPDDHEPRLRHEYQFDLDLTDAREAFSRLVAFLHRHSWLAQPDPLHPLTRDLPLAQQLT